MFSKEKNIYIKNEEPSLFFAFLSQLQHLKKLDLSNLSTLTPEAVKLVAKHCTLLDTLNLSLSKEVSDDSVSCVAVSCKRLTVLFLISCSITDRGKI